MPGPFSDAWAMEPKALEIITTHIREVRPKHVVEFGCGRSTLVLSKLAEEIGAVLVSVDNDIGYMRRVADAVTCPVQFVCCPLMRIGNELSYDMSKLDCEVDVAIVDGPPGRSSRLTRLIPLRWCVERFTTSIFLDDTLRPGENCALNVIQCDHPSLKIEDITTERGLARLWR